MPLVLLPITRHLACLFVGRAQGVLDYGDYWDSILSGLALLDAGRVPADVMPTASYLAAKVLERTCLLLGSRVVHAAVYFGWRLR